MSGVDEEKSSFQNGFSPGVVLVGMVLDGLVALGHLAYSAVLVVLACTALSGWRAGLALAIGASLFFKGLLHGHLYGSLTSIFNAGIDKGEAKRG